MLIVRCCGGGTKRLEFTNKLYIGSRTKITAWQDYLKNNKDKLMTKEEFLTCTYFWAVKILNIGIPLPTVSMK